MSLSAKRKAFVKIGGFLESHGELDSSPDVFFLTQAEFKQRFEFGPGEQRLTSLANPRKKEFSRIQRMFYPAFLSGNAPITPPGKLSMGSGERSCKVFQ